MNERCAGAFRALEWVLSLLDRHECPTRILREIEMAKNDLLRGVEVDFK